MATVNSVEYAKAIASLPSNKMGPEYGGGIRAILATYEASALAASSTINICTVPAGSYILPCSSVSYDALGTGSTIKIGDSGDDDRYLAAADTSSAGTSYLNKIDGVGYKSTAETLIYGTTTSGITGTLEFNILFVSY